MTQCTTTWNLVSSARVMALLTLLSGTSALAANTASGPLPAHPDKLSFKPFTYVPPNAKDYRTVLPTSHVPAYIAVDHELPLVNIVVFIHAGDYQEPADKAGLASLAGYLLSRSGTDGKKPYTAEALDERVAFLAASLQSAIGETNGQVSLNLLTKDLDEGLSILRDVLMAPRFADNKIALRKDQLLNEMKQRNDDSGSIEERERGVLAFGADHFTNHFMTKASLDSISKKDLVAFHRRWVHPQNFIVAASGDFDREEMVKKLDAMLASWPYQGEVAKAEIPKPMQKMAGGLYLVNKSDVTQGRVSIMLPGISRDDPDYYAIQVMNDILGGGGFTSRITNRVRSDEGLAYHAGSRFTGGVYYPDVFHASFQSKLRSVSFATAIVLEEMKKLREGGVTPDELSVAKKQLTETLPRRFPNKSQIVAVLATEEFTGRYKKDPDFYQHYRERIEKVGKEDIERVAKKWLDLQKVTILVVGKKDDLLNPDPKHPIKLDQILGSKLNELPLRDPLTMKPLIPGSLPVAPAAAPRPVGR